MTRLCREMQDDPAIFEAVFAAYIDDSLAGVGAITVEPSQIPTPLANATAVCASTVQAKRA
jgi:hypothetical protein